MDKREQMSIVVLGHVDHGKSTVIGRLLADTGSLPQGKLEQIKAFCERNARPFEYAFVLDALKDEQAQGITIDTARCFFKTTLRDYIIIDAPGHMEFLKNMITGAARAEAALLVIDAHEGIAENSRKHGYLASLLGINQFVVLVNKMDLISYDRGIFEEIRETYTSFLARLNIHPQGFVPICAREGENIVRRSERMPWYEGPCVLDYIDSFTGSGEKEDKPFRFPLQDVYRFTEEKDDRRIFAGTVESGRIRVGEEVIFLPSQKKSKIKSIEGFNALPRQEIAAGYATGFTLEEEIYVRPGEIMCKVGESLCHVSSRLRANIFWMGRAPMIKGKKYKLKLTTHRAFVQLVEILKVTDAADLSHYGGKQQLDRYEVAECILETTKPIAFDCITESEATGRFVIVDHYEISGGGIIMEALDDRETSLHEHIRRREFSWEKGSVSPADRERRYHHRAKFIVFTGSPESKKREIAKHLEKTLFEENYLAYYLGVESLKIGLEADVSDLQEHREEHIRRLGELARIITDSGMIFITAVDDVDDYDLEILKKLNAPQEILVVNIGKSDLASFRPDFHIEETADVKGAVKAVLSLLRREAIIPDYTI